MIVRSMDDIKGSLRDIMWGNGRSRRYLIEEDSMSYSLTDTLVYKNTRSLLEYKHHLEACLCIEGHGKVECPTTGKTFDITPGVMYALDNNDPHYLIAEGEELRLICVFSPALKGHEVHSLENGDSSAY